LVPIGRELGAGGNIRGTRGLEELVGDERLLAHNTGLATERLNRVRKSINGIGVVERLSAKSLVKSLAGSERGAVVNIGIRLDNPDKLLTRVVEVESDLVRRRTNRLSASELKLLDKVLVRVLGHAASLVSVKVDVVNVERSRNERLSVSARNLNIATTVVKSAYSEKALVNGAEVKVDLDLVVLEGNERKRKTRVGAEPELKRDVESGLRKSLSRGANLSRRRRIARAVNIGERRIGNEGELGGVTNHLVVTSLLVLVHGELAPDVHPVTVLLLNSLTTNLNLNVLNKLVTREVKPPGVNITISVERLSNLRKGNL